MIANTSLGSQNLRTTAPESVLVRLDQLALLKDGWDSYRAKAPSRAARARAATIIGDFVGPLVAGGCRIELGPSLDGGIIVNLSRGERDLELRIDNDGGLSVVRDEDLEGCESPAALKAHILELTGM